LKVKNKPVLQLILILGAKSDSAWLGFPVFQSPVNFSISFSGEIMGI
jgi:hypothetical protein